MKNKYVSTRIMAMVMAAAMTVSAAPAVYAAERADSETIKEDNQPAAEDSTESQTPKILPQRQPRQNIL